MGLDIVVYRRTPELEFRAGSYSGFGDWRRELATMVGIDLYCMKGYTDNGLVWDADLPFYELLNHSDCDGNLWHDECEALLEDFKKYEQEAIDWSKNMSESDGEWFIEKYNDWMNAVELMVEDEEGVMELVFC